MPLPFLSRLGLRARASKALDWLARVFLGAPLKPGEEPKREPPLGMLSYGLREAGILLIVFTFLDSFQDHTTLRGKWVWWFVLLGLAIWMIGFTIERVRRR